MCHTGVGTVDDLLGAFEYLKGRLDLAAPRCKKRWHIRDKISRRLKKRKRRAHDVEERLVQRMHCRGFGEHLVRWHTREFGDLVAIARRFSVQHRELCTIERRLFQHFRSVRN